MVDYERQTVDSPSPITRWAHRTRLRIARTRALEMQKGATIVDYGCGQGRFLSSLYTTAGDSYRLIGWDPHAASRFEGYEVISDPLLVAKGSVDMVTCLEVCEHLEENEMNAFLTFAHSVLKPGGVLLVSVPVMIGPSLLAKEVSRMRLFRKPTDYSLGELFSASVFCRGVPRAINIKTSHKGFDFRSTIEILRSRFGSPKLTFSPIPGLGWWGNSQAVIEVVKS